MVEMEVLPKSIDSKIQSESYCQSKAIEDVRIMEEENVPSSRSSIRNAEKSNISNAGKSNISRSFSEGSFQETSQSRRKFSYYTPFGMDSRLR